MVREAEVNPCSHRNARCDEDSDNDNILSTVFRLRTFRLPDRNDGIDSADSYARDDASYDKLCETE